MIVFPAIDLKGGKCVRLVQGQMNSSQVFNDDPVAQALAFVKLGFSWLHIVDLDGAFAGSSKNGEVVERIIRAVNIPIQLGGGLRNAQSVERWLELGVRRVILGTLALRNAELVKALALKFPGRIAVGIDARDGWVAIEGWAEVSRVEAISLAMQFEGAGVAALIYTDISRDGTGLGLNLEQTQKVARAVRIPVIASGGVGSLEDLWKLKLLNEPNICGAICGRALYDGRVDASEALKVMA